MTTSARSLPLSRETILTTALALIERDGIDRLSMRRLAASLGVEAMSLYNHIRNKDDVIDGVVDLVLARMPRHRPRDAFRGDWQEDVRAIALGFRQVALAHPGVMRILLTRQIFSDGALAITEAMLSALKAGGFPVRDAVFVSRALLSYLIGASLRDIGLSGPSAVETADVAAQEQILRDSGSPRVSEAAHLLARQPGQDDFAFGLDLMIAAIGQVNAPR